MTDDRDERGDSTEGLGADADASAGFAHSKEATEIIPEPVAVALAREIKRLTTVAEILRGWIWETDENHRFTYLSDSVQRFAGRSPEWHYGKTRKELGNLSADHEKNKIYLGQLERREKFGPIDLACYQNGTQHWMRTIGMPQVDAEGRFTGYCGVAFEVTAEIEGRQGNRRGEARRRVARTATISDQAAPSPIPCVVLDVSQGGARLDVHAAAAIPTRFKLVIDLDGTERICEVMWRRENSVGVRFCDTF